MKTIRLWVFLLIVSLIGLSTSKAQSTNIPSHLQGRGTKNCFLNSFFSSSGCMGREKIWLFGIDFQAYPAGQMYAIRGERHFGFGHEINLRLGYNRAFRKNFSGLNDDEQGGGPGFSIGYRVHPGYGYNNNFFLGTRVDLWQMKIFWKDNSQSPAKGSTDITVLQPTFEVGYRIRILPPNFEATIYAGFGQEINIITKGDPVGQGGMWLGGITLCYGLN